MFEMSKVPYTPGERPGWRETLKGCWRLVGVAYDSDKWSFILLWSMVFLGSPLIALTVIATGRILDELGIMSASGIWTWIGVLFAATYSRHLSTVINNNRVDRLSQTLTFELERRYLSHIIKLPYEIIEDPNYQALSSTVAEKRSQVSAIFSGIAEYASAIADIVGLATVVFYIPWPVALVMLIAMILRYASNRAQTNIQWGILKMNTREGRRAMYYRSALDKPQVLEKAKGIGLAEPFLKQWEKLARILVQKRLEARFNNSLWGVLLFFVDSAGIGLGMLLLSQDILSGKGSVSGFVVFMTSYQRIMPKVYELSHITSRFMIDAPVVPLIFRIFDIPAESDKGRNLPKESLTIRFESVSFRYPDTQKDVLQNVSFEFQEGDHLALVGLNGAGKTTILKLLMGVYEPTAGRITVNDIPLQDLKPSALRRALAIMNQEPPRYSDSIAVQVQYGDYDMKKDEERIDSVVEASGLSEVLEDLPNGMETKVGKFYAMPEDKAIELSGGQNQLLDIARTLYRQARIYVFDEPTSAVDAEKEESFFSRLPETLSGKAIIFVSHRFSTLRRAKRILVIEGGRLIEDGSHEELIEKKGRYAELFALQAKNYQ